MLNSAEIKFSVIGREDTPSIDFNGKTGELTISGKSLPDDAFEYYHHAIGWVRKYAEEPCEVTTFTMQITYMNSASAKRIIEILEILDSVKEHGNTVKIMWVYSSEDEDALDEGNEMERMCDIPFTYVSI
ncbi:MAG TPA: DUF1987 domain-containing protein [Williamwhitmania sp.]|nr:DUF1987 domain-containing protein [Williamwhitmania sp.]